MASPKLWLDAASIALKRRVQSEWFGSPPHLHMLSRPRTEGLAAFPHDQRPARPEIGHAIMTGSYQLAGASIRVGRKGDPWNRPSPSREFAAELHRFSWLRHLVAIGENGAAEALRLVTEWRRTFGEWSSFSWGGDVLERRVFNLACSLDALAALASENEVEMLAETLARQTRQLLATADPAWRCAERAVVAGVAAAALDGRAGERLLTKALRQINRLIPAAVLPDGGHASRSPEAGLELLLDLLALDDTWAQRGLETPVEAARAIDRLTAGLRFFTLPDGRLARFQGGEGGDPQTVAAARAHDDAEAAGPPPHMPYAGYQRLIGKRLQIMVDVGPPAPGVWSATACAQPGAIEIICGRDRLITNCGWSPRAPGAQAQRLTDAGSTAALGHESAGAPLGGRRAAVLGPRLVGGASAVPFKRSGTETGLWLDLNHDGWVRSFGLTHTRRLYLDLATDELRGEDQFNPAAPTASRVVAYCVRFHVPPEVEAVLARDNKSVLLKAAAASAWWLRNDATEVRIEPSVHFRDGLQMPSLQVVLMGHVRADKGGRVRWKLTAVE